MNLINQYIHEVIKRVPKKMRDDTSIKLKAKMEEMLPDEYTEEDVKAVLQELGHPALLASHYSNRPMHLIGPRYYDVYMTFLKIFTPIIVFITLFSVIIESFIKYNDTLSLQSMIITIITTIIVTIFSTVVQVFFWVTLVFTILEWKNTKKETTPLTIKFKEWTPADLEGAPYMPTKKSISKAEIVGGFIWTAVWVTVYFFAHFILAVYEKQNDIIVFVTPVLNQDVLISYWFFITMIVALEIMISLYKLFQRKWTINLATFNTIHQILIATVFISIISKENVFHPDFLLYMSDATTISMEQLVNRIVWGVITLLFVLAIWNSFNGFRKARCA